MIHVLYPEEISKKASPIANEPDLEPTPAIEESLDPSLPPSEARSESPRSLDETVPQHLSLHAESHPEAAGSATSDPDGSDPSLNPALDPSLADHTTVGTIDHATSEQDDASIPPETLLPDPYELHTAGPLTYFQYYIDDAESEASVDYAPQVFSTSKLPTGLISAGVLAVTVVSGFMIAESTKQPTLRPSAALNPSQESQPQASLPSSPSKTPIAQPSKPETIVAAKPLSIPRTPTFPAVPTPLPAPPPITPLSAAPKLQIHRGIKLTPMAIAQPETLSADSTALVAQAQSAPRPSLPEPLPSVTIPRDEVIPSLPPQPSPVPGANDSQPSEAMANPALNPSPAVNTPQPGTASSPIAPQSDLSTATVAPPDTSSSIAPSLSPTSNPSPTQSIVAASPTTIGKEPQPMPSPDPTTASTRPTSPIAPARDSTPIVASTASTQFVPPSNSDPRLTADSATTTAPNPSQILNSLRNLQDYLTVPQKLASTRSIDLLPLNLTAATEASTQPTGIPIDHYTIVRMNYSDYARAWRTSSNPDSSSSDNSSGDSFSNPSSVSGFPPHGFIDYKHQRIVLPQDTASATRPLTSPSTQISQTLHDR